MGEFDPQKKDYECLRSSIENVKTEVLEVRNHASNGEEMANVMLTYRHLEDARMRLGKAIQAREAGGEGGKSKYDE